MRILTGHPTCMNLVVHGEVVYPWKCIECKTCEVCQEKGDDVSMRVFLTISAADVPSYTQQDRILFCDWCDRGECFSLLVSACSLAYSAC